MICKLLTTCQLMSLLMLSLLLLLVSRKLFETFRIIAWTQTNRQTYTGENITSLAEVKSVYTFSLVTNLLYLIQGRTGPLGNREISRWAPASGSLLGPRPYTRIYFIDNQLRNNCCHQLRLLGPKYVKQCVTALRGLTALS